MGMNRELKIPIALRNGEFVTIDDIAPEDRGLECGCICPNCKCKLVAKLGDVRQHHFAHSGEGCDFVVAYLKGLYGIINQCIERGRFIHLPSLRGVFPEKDWAFQKSAIKCIGERPVAIVAETETDKIAIVIVPPNTVCKIGTVERYKDYNTVFIDFTRRGEYISNSTTEQIASFIASPGIVGLCKWIPKSAEDEAPKKFNGRADASSASQNRTEERFRFYYYEGQQKKRSKYDIGKRVIIDGKHGVIVDKPADEKGHHGVDVRFDNGKLEQFPSIQVLINKRRIMLES